LNVDNKLNGSFCDPLGSFFRSTAIALPIRAERFLIQSDLFSIRMDRCSIAMSRINNYSMVERCFDKHSQQSYSRVAWNFGPAAGFLA
jgi:hypothetical protein